jgi:peptidoglycan/LPS O-acetylase OafA/YrhL
MRRDLALDALRTLAVLGMMATHTTRMIPLAARWEVNRWAMLLEPIIPALFLALVGASIGLSRVSVIEKGADAIRVWNRRQIRRAVLLWLVGIVFYLCEDGFHWPDAVFAPGILGTIGYAILLLTALFALPKPWVGLAVIWAAGCAAYLYLDAHGLSVFWFTSGNSPMLPLLLFALMGALSSELGKIPSRYRYPLRYLAFAVGFMGSTWLFYRFGADALFSKPFGRSDATRWLVTQTAGMPVTKAIGYYNLRPVLSLLVACLILATYSFLSWAEFLLRPVSKWLLILGRHSLGVYILHLSLLALAVLRWGMKPFPAAWIGAGVYVMLVLICEFYALWRERAKTI